MFTKSPIRSCVGALALGLLFLLPAHMRAQQNQILGELRFSGATKVERNSGVWIDGLYVSYLGELKGNKKIMLLTSKHEVSVRQAGYKDFTREIVIEPGRRHLLHVAMEKDHRAIYPGADAAELKLDIKPNRAAVFLDTGYVGHASDFGGAFWSLTLSPGRHRIKIELPGYRTFETGVNLLPHQKSEIKTELLKGSIQQAGELVKEP
jgi:PEGA domain